MSNEIENRKAIYRESRLKAGVNKRQWGRLFSLGVLTNCDQVVSHKESPLPPAANNTSKGVNKAEALAAQLLLFLHDSGYDICKMSFDSEGRITEIPFLD